MNPARIGFIGIGAMGAPMAARLVQAGHTVTVFDAKPGVAERFAVDRGGSAAQSATEAIRNAQLVITMLRTSKDVKNALLGEAALVLASGTTVIDMTSGSPEVTKSIAAELQGRGIAMLDAPVSGGVKGAREGALTMMVGGSPSELERWLPLLKVFGSKIFHVGQVGAGQAMKALNNLVNAAGLTAAAEAIVIGKRFGLDPAQMIDIFNVSSARNHSTETKFKTAILPGTYAGGFAFDLMLKDISIAVNLAEQTGTPAELGHACVALWERARGALSSGADSTEIARWLETEHSDKSASGTVTSNGPNR